MAEPQKSRQTPIQVPVNKNDKKVFQLLVSYSIIKLVYRMFLSHSVSQKLQKMSHIMIFLIFTLLDLQFPSSQ